MGSRIRCAVGPSIQVDLPPSSNIQHLNCKMFSQALPHKRVGRSILLYIRLPYMIEYMIETLTNCPSQQPQQLYLSYLSMSFHQRVVTWPLNSADSVDQ